MRISGVKKADVVWVQKRLLEWFDVAGRHFPWRRQRLSNYEYVIAEVLLQRTTARAVEATLPTFLHRFPNWSSIAAASLEEIGRVLRPLGLWRRRSISLKALAGEMVRRKGRFPRTRDAIESLPGVGQYIANAIELFAHGRRRPLLDVNMARVLERVFGPRRLADIRYDPYLQTLSAAVVDHPNSMTINWAFLDLGALICRPQPLCAVCPLLARCKTGRTVIQPPSTFLRVAESRPDYEDE